VDIIADLHACMRPEKWYQGLLASPIPDPEPSSR